jgi:hypothetical protein
VVITTRKEDSLISDLVETFDNLNRFKLKLNPIKCSFGVSAGQLLGFLVSARGIEANPEKIQAILTRVFYFCAPSLLVVLSFPQPLNFSSVFPSL